MKLVIAIVNSDDAQLVISELTKSGFIVTKLSTSGGFLRAGNVTLMIGIEEERVKDVVSVIEEYSSQRKQLTPINAAFIGDSMLSAAPVEVTVGGATVFVLDVEQFFKL
ncbi:MAG: cyclic-di-AMP receptor [Oscillospiraceae bacterium]